MSALEAGLATLPAAAAMILMTPFITPLAMKIGSRQAVGLGFLAAAGGFVVLAFVESSWSYGVFVAPLIVIAAGLGLANGPASSASTAFVEPDEVGAASGISNMARYIGGSLAVAAVATIYDSVTSNQLSSGASQADALATGLSRSFVLLAIVCGAGVVLVRLMRRAHIIRSDAVSRAAAAAAVSHTIPTEPVAAADPDLVPPRRSERSPVAR
jgi:MFS family permease